ncbi:MAG: hypothetical protein ACKO5E_04295 [bacterium]
MTTEAGARSYLAMKLPFATLSLFSLVFLASGCGGGASHQPTELHDQKGEHLNFPAGGPNSPDAKKAAKTAEPPKTEAKKS